MDVKKLINELREKGILKDFANEDYFLKKINDKNKKVYVGIDPTGNFLHLGHFYILNLVRILSKYGFKIYFLLGDFTAMIGDPSGKKFERQLMSKNVIDDNVNIIKKLIVEFCAKSKVLNYEIRYNSKFYEDISISEFYQKYGKLFNLSNMLNKDMIQKRLGKGISYTEFSYQIFQAIDFLKLFENDGVILEIGGSDQWGNIIQGIDVINKLKDKKEVFGFTIDLLLDLKGEKLGKTSDNKVIKILSNDSNPFTIYQYLINLSDDDSFNLLNKLTLLSVSEINEILKESKKFPKDKIIQNKMIEDLFESVFSKNEYIDISNISKHLFSRDNDSLYKYKNLIEKYIKVIKLVNNTNLRDLIIQNNLKGYREYKEFLKSKSIKLNGEVVNSEDYIIDIGDNTEGKLFILEIGSKQRIVILV